MSFDFVGPVGIRGAPRECRSKIICALTVPTIGAEKLAPKLGIGWAGLGRAKETIVPHVYGFESFGHKIVHGWGHMIQYFHD